MFNFKKLIDYQPMTGISENDRPTGQPANRPTGQPANRPTGKQTNLTIWLIDYLAGWLTVWVTPSITEQLTDGLIQGFKRRGSRAPVDPSPLATLLPTRVSKRLRIGDLSKEPKQLGKIISYSKNLE